MCTSDDPRDRRTRCAVAVGLPQGVLLIDTPPDLRMQLLRERIGIVHAVLFTHDHADHLFGLDDLRLFPFYLGHAVPIYCEAESASSESGGSLITRLRSWNRRTRGRCRNWSFSTIDTQPFEVLGQPIVPIRLRHGPRFEVLGFRIGGIAYCTDTNEIPAESWPRLEGLRRADPGRLAATPAPHAFFAGGSDRRWRIAWEPKRTYFTHISHDLSHEQTNRQLPAGMQLAYDGLRIPLG